MLVYFAVILTVLLGFCGLAIDVGRVELRTLQLQAAADAGAIGGAEELQHGTGSNFATAANADIATVESLNGIASTGSASPTVVATYGPYINDYSTVQVSITEDFPTLFLGLISQASASISLTANAVAESPPCFVFLANPGENNMWSNSNVGYQIASAGLDSNNWQCPIYSKTGVLIDGFARMGGSQVRNSGSAAASIIQGSVWVTPIYNAPLISDPLAYVIAPTPGACINSAPLSYTASKALPPGTYCGKTIGTVTTPALSMTGTYTTGVGAHCTSNPVLALSPGLYVFVGGAYLNCVTVTGAGVTTYFTRNVNTNYGIFGFYSSTWNVSAPIDASKGGIPGIVLFGDRAWSGGNQDFNIMFSTWYGDGVLYVSNTGIYDWITSMSAPNYLNIVSANMYTYDSEIRPSINYTSLPGGSPLHTMPTLVQ